MGRAYTGVSPYLLTQKSVAVHIVGVAILVHTMPQRHLAGESQDLGDYSQAVYMDNGSPGHFRVHCSPETGFNPDLVGAAYT